jgi:hypothetical protein
MKQKDNSPRDSDVSEQLGAHSLPLANLPTGHHQVVCNYIRHHAVMLVVTVLHHELADPGGGGH